MRLLAVIVSAALVGAASASVQYERLDPRFDISARHAAFSRSQRRIPVLAAGDRACEEGECLGGKWDRLSNIGLTVSDVTLSAEHLIDSIFKRAIPEDDEDIVIMPDEVGQGLDSQSIHPYVTYPKVEELVASRTESVKENLLDQRDVSATTEAVNAIGANLQLVSPQDIGAEVRMNPDLKDLGPDQVVVIVKNATLPIVKTVEAAVSDAVTVVTNATLPVVKIVDTAVTDAIATAKNATLPVVKTIENAVTDIFTTITDAVEDTVQRMLSDI